jgi:hypothetical protein
MRRCSLQPWACTVSRAATLRSNLFARAPHMHPHEYEREMSDGIVHRDIFGCGRTSVRWRICGHASASPGDVAAAVQFLRQHVIGADLHIRVFVLRQLDPCQPLPRTSMSVQNIPSTISVLRPVALSGPDATAIEEALPNHSTETHPDTVSTHSDGHHVAIDLSSPSPKQSARVSPRDQSGSPRTPKALVAVLPQRPEPAAARISAGEPGGPDDEVNDIELGIEDLSSEDESGVVGFTAAEIAGRAMGGRHHQTYEERLGLPTRHDAILEHSQRARIGSDAEEKHLGTHSGRHSPHSNTNTRTILLTDLPDSTIPPDSRAKMQTFAALKQELRWWVWLMLFLSAGITVLGVVDIAIAAISIPTAFLFPIFPYLTLVAGIIMLPLGPVSAFLILRYQTDQLRLAYLCCFAAFGFALISGIIVATKEPDSINKEVGSHWVYDRSSSVVNNNGMYTPSLQDHWSNDPAKLISDARGDLANMTIVLLISAVVAVAEALLAWRTCNRLQAHFHLTAIQTESKSATVATRAKRRQEILEYKDAMQRDVEMARVVEEERIPEEVKLKLSLSASKYFESGNAPPNPTASVKGKNRRIDPAAPRPASAKSQSRKLARQGSGATAPSGTGSLKLQRAASANAAAAAASNVLPATSTRSKREGSSSTTHPSPLMAAASAALSSSPAVAAAAPGSKKSRPLARTPEERAARKRRKKERREKKAPQAQESGGLPTGPNVIEGQDSSDSDPDDGFTAVKL